MAKRTSVKPLEWTGERLVTTCHRPLVYEHLHRYGIACALAKGKAVLDIACGEGYGANLIAQVAANVVGVDIDLDTIAHAKAAYRRRNLRFVRGSCAEIPCEDHSIHLVASFETIEHISEHDRFLAEIKRVLAPGGILVISSPDKMEYRRVSEAANPFHQAELNHDAFVQLMAQSFKHCVVGKQRLVVGSWIAPDAPSAKVSASSFHGGFDGIEVERGVYRGLYSIAVCSDRTLPTLDLGVFENYRDSADVWNLLDVYDSPSQISAQITELTQTSEETTTQLANLQNSFDEKSKHVSLLQSENKEKVQQVAHFQRDAEERAKHVTLLQRENEERTKQVSDLQKSFEEKSKHVALLQRENEEKAKQVVHFQRDAEERAKQVVDLQKGFDEKSRHVALLQRETEEKGKQVAHFQRDAEERAKHVALLQRENEEKARNIERLQHQIEHRDDELARASSEVLDARWEVLTLRREVAHNAELGEPPSQRVLDLETRIATATSERDHLRAMLIAVQKELEDARLSSDSKQADIQSLQQQLNATQEQLTGTREQLRTTTKDVRFQRKQMERIREGLSHKLILPFGRSQRKIQRLTANGREE